MLDNYKLSDEEKNEIKNIEDRIKNEKLYKDFVSSQESGFIRFIEYVNDEIKYLHLKGKISSFIELRARIKDVRSALNNNNTKMIDDVFGVEIICANENEIEIIKAKLEETMKSTRSKDHDKENGYKAIHRSYSSKKEDNYCINRWKLKEDDVPAVECQFKTIAVETNPNASHHDYKKVNKEEIQEVLDKKVMIIGDEIPKMWISDNGKIRELSYKEIISKIYPFIDTTTIKEPNEKIKFK